MRKLSQFDTNRMQYLCYQGRLADMDPLPEPLCSILSDPQCTAFLERTHLQQEEEHTLIQLSCRRISDNILMPAGLEWSLDWLIKQFKKYDIKTIIEYVSYGFSSRKAFRNTMEALTKGKYLATASTAPLSETQTMAPPAGANNCHSGRCDPTDDIIMEDSLQHRPHALYAASQPATPAAAIAAAITSEPASNAWLEHLLYQPPSSSPEPWHDDAQWQSFRGMLCSSLDQTAPSYRPAFDLSAH